MMRPKIAPIESGAQHTHYSFVRLMIVSILVPFVGIGKRCVWDVAQTQYRQGTLHAL